VARRQQSSSLSYSTVFSAATTAARAAQTDLLLQLGLERVDIRPLDDAAVGAHLAQQDIQVEMVPAPSVLSLDSTATPYSSGITATLDCSQAMLKRSYQNM
jgi:hypothetical protein